MFIYIQISQLYIEYYSYIYLLYIICNQIENAILGIYNGGSEKSCWFQNNCDITQICLCNNQLNVFTGNDNVPSKISSTGNQMFIKYTDNGDGAPGKGFSASFTFGKKVTNLSFFFNFR